MTSQITSELPIGPCKNDNTKVYIQYTCEIDPSETKSLQKKAITVVTVCFIISIVYLLTIYYLQATSGLDYKDWDVDTVTVSDYAC